MEVSNKKKITKNKKAPPWRGYKKLGLARVGTMAMVRLAVHLAPFTFFIVLCRFSIFTLPLARTSDPFWIGRTDIGIAIGIRAFTVLVAFGLLRLLRLLWILGGNICIHWFWVGTLDFVQMADFTLSFSLSLTMN